MVRIGNSRINGQGLFAVQDITKGTRIITYIGEKITRKESARRLEAGNAYIFHLNYRYALDGETLANTARYINHSCDPNCEALITGKKIFIHALRGIYPGTELAYDYQYERTGRNDAKLEKFYLCKCGAENCRGSIMKPAKKRSQASQTSRSRSRRK